MPTQGEVVLGIDLGTTNTAAVAFIEGSERPVSILHGRNQPVMPTVVSFSNPSMPLVGWLAKDMLLTHPHNTVAGWKRFIGRSDKSAFVSRYRDRASYQIHSDPQGNLGAVIDGAVVSFVQIAALVLDQVRLQASAALKRPVSDCVIAVPAHFANAQRAAVREAGRRAGLNILRLVNEPTAAALAFGIDHKLDTQVLVFDLGGGTFDATLLQITDNIFDVRATRGEGFLGGIDFDRALYERLVEFMHSRHRVDLRASTIVAQRVMRAAEYAKCELSDATRAKVHVPGVAEQPQGGLLDLDYELDRSELEALTAPLVESCMGTVEAMLADTQVAPEEVDYVVAVGGQSRMPLVHRRLEQLMGRAPLSHMNINTCVAHGAALVAKGERELTGAVLMDVLSVPIGAVFPGGRTEWLFASNSALPAERRLEISPPPSLSDLTVGVWQGPDITSAERQVLGVIRIPAHAFSGPGPFVLELKLNASLGIQVALNTGRRRIPLELAASNR